MGKRGLTPEQIVDKLHEAVIINQTLRRGHGDIRVYRVRHLKELEHENSCLKKLVADLSIDNKMLKEEGPGLLPLADSNSIVEPWTPSYFAGR